MPKRPSPTQKSAKQIKDYKAPTKLKDIQPPPPPKEKP